MPNTTIIQQNTISDNHNITFHKAKGDIDIQVKLNDKCLCWITKNDIEAFIIELENVLDKYRI